MWFKLFHLHYELLTVVRVRLHMGDYVKCTAYIVLIILYC